MKGEEEDENKRQGIITKIISYFKYDPNLQKRINIALLFNAYISFFEIIALAFVNVFFTTLKISSITTIYTMTGVIQIGMNFLPRVNMIMLFFEIMLVIQVSLIGLMIMVFSSTINVLATINFTCKQISGFYMDDRASEFTSQSVCSELGLKYMI